MIRKWFHHNKETIIIFGVATLIGILFALSILSTTKTLRDYVETNGVKGIAEQIWYGKERR